MTAEVRVFVSHSHLDAAFTQRLVSDLRAAGADVWVDTDHIGSDDFIRRINEGFIGRQWLVLVMTPRSLHSRWVHAEVNAALNQVRKGRMRAVIPVIAETCDEADIPALWDSLFRVDARVNYPHALNRLCKSLELPALQDAATASQVHQPSIAESQQNVPLPRPTVSTTDTSQIAVNACRCGCGTLTRDNRVFVNKEHQLTWMANGGARELNALMAQEARVKGGRISGQQALQSGRLLMAGRKGAERCRQIAEAFHASRNENKI